MAGNPASESELQLYRVLQRANLLQYFETFISQGGDDVQQLCEAGEEEFLEIMALVGMASKPLHVRRLQKALQEWVTNPSVFHQPLGPHTAAPPVAPGSILASVQRPYLKVQQTSTPIPMTATPHTAWTPQDSGAEMLVTPAMSTARSLSPGSVTGNDGGIYSESVINVNGSMGSGNGHPIMTYTVDSPESGGASSLMMDDQMMMTGSPATQSTLTEAQIKAIEKASEDLAKTLPQYEPKPLNMKKLISKEIEEVIKLPTDQPGRMDLLRKYGSIYGRFDSRRRNEKTLSLHEISVNEAAAQLCKHRASLLTRRDDLFPLARQVVRDSGYQYSKGHSRGQVIEIPPNKKQRLDSYLKQQEADQKNSGSPKCPKVVEEKHIRELRMSQINQELTDITAQQQGIKRQLQQRKTDDQGVSPTQQGEAPAVSPTPQGAALQSELETLTARQLKLLNEQSEIIRRHRSIRRSQFKKKNGKCPTTNTESQDDDDDSIPFPSESSPHNPLEEVYAVPVSAAQAAKDMMQQSLFDEGLRIAQQYGMADFENELQGLQHPGKPAVRVKQELVVADEYKTQEGAHEVSTQETEEHWQECPQSAGFNDLVGKNPGFPEIKDATSAVNSTS